VHNCRALGSVARANGTGETYFARNPMLALNIYDATLLQTSARTSSKSAGTSRRESLATHRRVRTQSRRA
jgi:hypothetical protein